MKIILGIDPGANTGLAVVAFPKGKAQLLDRRTIRTKPREPLPERLATVFRGVVLFIQTYRPDIVAVEGMRTWMVRAGGVKSTVIQAQFHGAVLAAVMHARPPGCQVQIIPPPRTRWSGRGRTRTVGLATKEYARRVCETYFGKSDLSEHEADAAVLALAARKEQK
ncbi:crossover junction endodeoxyribonuclease RuvC [Thermogutta sp.]|uniref:crossover junction endodeoxyribonuclease RuvC n=1 Tax=Thermogutta sp. TaxID=1962930 RepID=UPI00321F6A55